MAKDESGDPESTPNYHLRSFAESSQSIKPATWSSRAAPGSGLQKPRPVCNTAFRDGSRQILSTWT
jgi:hypothetical protein